ncbi:MAG: type II CAAX endopeptidase family protein [Myxococcota bacterium]|nr:type II CAAX endopeptidase family protein [Myxococcota bacterium]
MKRTDKLVSLAAMMYGAMLLLALVWGVLRGLTGGWWRFENWVDVPPAAVLGIALGLTGVLLSLHLDRRVPSVRKLGDRFAAILAGASTRDAIILAALSSLGEELLFRGCLQEEWGLWPATLLFAIVHTGPGKVYLWWTASAFVFGLGLALLYDYQGGLLAPILMHFTINAINIRLLGQRGQVDRSDQLNYDF